MQNQPTITEYHRYCSKIYPFLRVHVGGRLTGQFLKG